MYQTQKCAQCAPTSCGPKARAGFIAPPVSTPPIRTSAVIVRPITRPEICLNVPRGSTAVAKKTNTRKKVSTASTTTAAPEPMPPPSAGTPRCDCDSIALGSTHLRSSAAVAAAENCTIQYQAASIGAIRFVTRKPSVTDGLKCPPEMKPTADIITAITRPFASAMSVSVRANATQPAPTKMSANVPTNSAAPRRR